MTARLASHPDVANHTTGVLERLSAAGVDVDFVELEDGGAFVEAGEARADVLQALRDATIDLALVGIQALRGSAADTLTTVAVLPRSESRDVLVSLSSPTTLAGLPAGARVGVVGQRREAFLTAHRPDVEPVALERGAMRAIARDAGRGVAAGADLDALVLTAVDARMSGLTDAAMEVLDAKAWLPEPGQGALALIARHPIAEATALDHLPTRTALRAELALLDALDADGDAPLGCLAQPSGRWIRLWAAAASMDGRRLVRSDQTGPLDEPESLGASVARQLVERGYGLVIAGEPV